CLAAEIPARMTRMRAVARTWTGPEPLFLMDTGPAAVLGALDDPRVGELEHVMVVNLGNFHTIAALLDGRRIAGLFEHHTGELTLEKLEGYLDGLANGTLSNQAVFDDMGHGALELGPIAGPSAPLALTGPRRGLLERSRLRSHLAVPHGDMMLTGCFGLLRALALRLPELAPAIAGQLGAPAQQPTTLSQLRQSEYRVLPVKQAMRKNLIRKIKAGEELFPGIIGFEGSVIPQIENAILSGQDIVFLGERGQAKSRLIRLLTSLLDEEVPVIDGCEINDNPYAPICRACRDRVAAQGDRVTVRWITPEERYSEKLATPDTSIADLIGEVDPIRVAEGKYLADELTIHYGLVPRTNRGIFAINELPDLAERIQVGLLNLVEERDVQIRGFKLRLPIDVYVVAS